MSKSVRGPWGLPGWLYWVIIVLVAAMLAAIPYVGPLLALFILFLGIPVWSISQRKAKSQELRMSRVALSARQEVVGESWFQSPIGDFKDLHGRKVQVVLRFDAGHPRAQSQVRVDLWKGDQSVPCGWLPERDSYGWAHVMRQAQRQGELLFCDAEIRGGWEKAPAYGVWLVPERVTSR